MIRIFRCLTHAFVATGLLLAAGAQAQSFEEGVHYERIPGPDVERSERIEVVEAFGYPCPACRNFLPYITSWENNHPEFVDFRRLPVSIQRTWEPFSRGYYTARVMEVGAGAHEDLFKALHDKGRQLRNIDELADFYADYDIDPEEFRKTARSFAVDSRLRQSTNDIRNWGIRATPTVVVNGRWRVSPRRGSTYEEMIRVIDYLVEREAEASGIEFSGDSESGGDTSPPS